jgi:TolA-binding protein
MRQKILRAVALCAFASVLAASARAQTPATKTNVEQTATNLEQPATPPAPSGIAPQGKMQGSLFALDELQQQLRVQREEIEQLRSALKEQSRLIGELRSRVEVTEQNVAAVQAQAPVVRAATYTTTAGAEAKDATLLSNVASATGAAGAGVGVQESKLEERVKHVEEQSKKTSDAVAKQLGSLTFSGDMRFRYESFYGQQNALAGSDNPATLGNPISTRQRLRMRARFGVRGKVSDEFEWGLRLTTGSFADVISTNQSLTDFFTRKPFALDQAYITYKPKALPGFQLQAGKFETPWTRTEMTWDNDISPEGLNESYTRTFKKSSFKNVALVAWQLPMLERNSAFVLGADGHVDLSASGRAGRDLALYGAQARTEIAPSKNVSLKLSAADLYFSGTQLITPAQVFGSNIQFPVTFTIPASGTTPARTITTQVSVPRELLVAGNGNLGLSLANTNATNRDGRLSSGYNLVDLIARADFTRSKRWPVMMLFDFVTNTQTHDVVTAGPTGADVLLPNREGQGFWAEFQIGKDVLRLPVDKISRGDVTFNYTFLRLEKDAILSPFNWSDIGQSTDVRVHRFIVGYAADPRVTLSLTGIFTGRPTGLLGPFGQTPPGSLNRTLTRLQLDTILRF